MKQKMIPRASEVTGPPVKQNRKRSVAPLDLGSAEKEAEAVLKKLNKADPWVCGGCGLKECSACDQIRASAYAAGKRTC